MTPPRSRTDHFRTQIRRQTPCLKVQVLDQVRVDSRNCAVHKI